MSNLLVTPYLLRSLQTCSNAFSFASRSTLAFSSLAFVAVWLSCSCFKRAYSSATRFSCALIFCKLSAASDFAWLYSSLAVAAARCSSPISRAKAVLVMTTLKPTNKNRINYFKVCWNMMRIPFNYLSYALISKYYRYSWRAFFTINNRI